MLRCLTLLAIAALLSSCAKPPLLEMEAAEYMVGKAYAMQAAELAPTEYCAAKTALADAQKSMQEADYSDARDSLDFSLQHARRAVILTEEVKVRRAEEAAEQARAEQAAQEAALKLQAEKTVLQAKAPPPPAKPPVKPTPQITLATSYTVVGGETLWTISAQPQVYNEGLLWPLLYQANRDQIKDPRQIFPGQSLSIRRDMTEKELEEARQRARESDIFPVPEAMSVEQ